MKIKSILLLTIIFLMAFWINRVYGQTATSSPTVKPTVTGTDESAIQGLKDKIADKVAEIRKKNNRAVAGRVLSVSSSSMKIKTEDQSDFEVKIDEALTKYYQITGAQQKEIDKENIEKDDYIIITGVISEKSITANSIFIDQEYFVGSGKISEVDSDNYTVKVIAPDKTVYNLSVETFTKQQIVNIKTLEIEKIGFSKIIAGDSIHFAVKVVGDEKNNTYPADKLLIVPQEYFIK
ncbi:hypothetical protein HZA76_04295 [Candidatus Roizmanbacteria bacterium]|nr:hypothetical protein [Candidatus Roizmanbacteria bacterium]